MTLFEICDQIKNAKKEVVKLNVSGDYVRFTKSIAKMELRNAEAELADKLREIYRSEGEARFNQIVSECNAYMEKDAEQTKDIQISYYKNVLAKESTPVSLSKFLFSAKHKESVTDIRKAATNKDINVLKSTMPCATISGTFGAHTYADLISYNGLAVMDFDGKDNETLTPEGMKAILSNMKEVYYAGVSIGGKGVYAIIKTDNRDPAKHFSMIEGIGEMIKNFGLNYDTSGKDVNRLRYVSYDPTPYFNEASETLRLKNLPRKEIKKLVPRIYNESEQNSTRAKIDRCIRQIEAHGINLADDYATWIPMGFALASELGHDGEDYFLRASQFSGKFDPAKCSKKYSNLLKHCKNVSTIGVFFNICKQNGISIA